MDYTHWLVILSVVISFAGGIIYIRDTLSGKAKPNRITWSLWAVAPLIGTVAALSANADTWATARVFLAGFVPLLVFIASFFNKKSYWKLTGFDFACGASSLLGLLLWAISGSPQTAILFAVVADSFASLPTIYKTWKFPETESGAVYVTSFVGVLLIIPSIPVWNIENAAFQVYLFANTLIMMMLVYRKKWFRRFFL